MSSETPKVFISYSHEDREWVDKLQVHLAPIVRELGIDVWDDSRIQAGMKWSKKINEVLADAQVAILLISPHFLASEFIANEELPYLLKAADKDGVLIIPIILSGTRFDKTPGLKEFQAINSLDNPLKALSEVECDEVLDEVAEAVEVHLLEASEPQVSQTISKEPVGQPSAKVSSELEDLIIKFLTEWNNWYFNATRIYNWGAKRSGFECFKNYSPAEIREILENLAKLERLKVREGKKGSMVYKIVES